MNDVIVASVEQRCQPGEPPSTVIQLHSGQVLEIRPDAVAMYRHAGAMGDPFGNGLLGHETLPAQLLCDSSEAPVTEQRAGYVKLQSGAVLFIRPDGVALYAQPDDALRNRNLVWLIPFTP